MVGLFSSYNLEKKKEDQVIGERDKDDEHNSLLHDDDVVDDDDDGDDGVEFKPIEHPLEPPEDDHPAKCPTMPDLSFIYDDCVQKEPFGENPQKRAEPLVASDVDAKKHHKIARDSANAYQFMGSQYNIFEVFQQCKEFEFS